MKREDITIEQVANLYNSGLSENAISKQLGIARTGVRPRLLKAGIHIRTQSEAEKLKWSQMTPEKRLNQIKAYHDKIRGSKRSHECLISRAIGVQKHAKLSIYEKLFYEAFTNAGLIVVPQYAVDIYNIDFAIPEKKIAIEINGGNWHTAPNKSWRDVIKHNFLVNLGWKVVEIEAHRKKLQELLEDAANIVTEYNLGVRS